MTRWVNQSKWQSKTCAQFISANQPVTVSLPTNLLSVQKSQNQAALRQQSEAGHTGYCSSILLKMIQQIIIISNIFKYYCWGQSLDCFIGFMGSRWPSVHHKRVIISAAKYGSSQPLRAEVVMHIMSPHHTPYVGFMWQLAFALFVLIAPSQLML